MPFELGRATEHVESSYLIARELADAASYFLSHGTALELHRMVTQPNFTVYVSCTRRVRPQPVGGYASPVTFLEDWISTQHAQQLAAYCRWVGIQKQRETHNHVTEAGCELLRRKNWAASPYILWTKKSLEVSMRPCGNRNATAGL